MAIYQSFYHLPFRFPQHCYTSPLSVRTSHFRNGGNIEIVYFRQLFVDRRIIFYFVLSRVTGTMCTKRVQRIRVPLVSFFVLILPFFSRKKKHSAVKYASSVTCSDKLSLHCFCFRVCLFVFSNKYRTLCLACATCFAI